MKTTDEFPISQAVANDLFDFMRDRVFEMDNVRLTRVIAEQLGWTVEISRKDDGVYGYLCKPDGVVAARSYRHPSATRATEDAWGMLCYVVEWLTQHKCATDLLKLFPCDVHYDDDEMHWVASYTSRNTLRSVVHSDLLCVIATAFLLYKIEAGNWEYIFDNYSFDMWEKYRASSGPLVAQWNLLKAKYAKFFPEPRVRHDDDVPDLLGAFEQMSKLLDQFVLVARVMND